MSSNRRWSRDELRLCARAYRQGGLRAALAALNHSRSAWAIYCKMNKIGCPAGPAR